MTGAAMKLDAAWIPLALGRDIESGTSAGAVVGAAEIVVWRDEQGRAHAWEDRCPHRGMRLSFGFVRGDRIACLYHGWQYDTAGQCRLIPAHPALDVPATIKVPVYETREACGIIWATTAAGAVLPEIAGAVTPLRSLAVDRPVEAVLTGLSSQGVLSHVAGALHRLAVGADALLIALQRSSSEKTVLHLVIESAPVADGGDRQRRVAHWAEGFRFGLEAPEFV